MAAVAYRLRLILHDGSLPRSVIDNPEEAKAGTGTDHPYVVVRVGSMERVSARSTGSAMSPKWDDQTLELPVPDSGAAADPALLIQLCEDGRYRRRILASGQQSLHRYRCRTEGHHQWVLRTNAGDDALVNISFLYEAVPVDEVSAVTGGLSTRDVVCLEGSNGRALHHCYGKAPAACTGPFTAAMASDFDADCCFFHILDVGSRLGSGIRFQSAVMLCTQQQLQGVPQYLSDCNAEVGSSIMFDSFKPDVSETFFLVDIDHPASVERVGTGARITLRSQAGTFLAVDPIDGRVSWCPTVPSGANAFVIHQVVDEPAASSLPPPPPPPAEDSYTDVSSVSVSGGGAGAATTAAPLKYDDKLVTIQGSNGRLLHHGLISSTASCTGPPTGPHAHLAAPCMFHIQAVVAGESLRYGSAVSVYTHHPVGGIQRYINDTGGDLGGSISFSSQFCDAHATMTIVNVDNPSSTNLLVDGDHFTLQAATGRHLSCEASGDVVWSEVPPSVDYSFTMRRIMSLPSEPFLQSSDVISIVGSSFLYLKDNGGKDIATLGTWNPRLDCNFVIAKADEAYTGLLHYGMRVSLRTQRGIVCPGESEATPKFAYDMGGERERYVTFNSLSAGEGEIFTIINPDDLGSHDPIPVNGMFNLQNRRGLVLEAEAVGEVFRWRWNERPTDTGRMTRFIAVRPTLTDTDTRWLYGDTSVCSGDSIVLRHRLNGQVLEAQASSYELRRSDYQVCSPASEIIIWSAESGALPGEKPGATILNYGSKVFLQLTVYGQSKDHFLYDKGASIGNHATFTTSAAGLGIGEMFTLLDPTNIMNREPLDDGRDVAFRNRDGHLLAISARTGVAFWTADRDVSRQDITFSLHSHDWDRYQPAGPLFKEAAPLPSLAITASRTRASASNLICAGAKVQLQGGNGRYLDTFHGEKDAAFSAAAPNASTTIYVWNAANPGESGRPLSYGDTILLQSSRGDTLGEFMYDCCGGDGQPVRFVSGYDSIGVGEQFKALFTNETLLKEPLTNCSQIVLKNRHGLVLSVQEDTGAAVWVPVGSTVPSAVELSLIVVSS